MALYETIRNALGSYTPGNQEEIKLHIKPFQADLAGGPGETTGGSVSSPSGAGGAGGTAAPTDSPGSAGTTASPTGYGTGGASVVPQNQQLSNNPQLPSTPSGAYTDDIYAASLAQARHETQRQYMDILQQLGFVDDQGHFSPGLIETNAARQRAELNRQLGLATAGVTENAQRTGTVFSGRRAVLQGRAENPYVTGLAQLEADTPLQLGRAYQSATDVLGNFGLTMQQLIAEAASRAAGARSGQPGTGGAPGTGTGAPGTAPPGGALLPTPVYAPGTGQRWVGGTGPGGDAQLPPLWLNPPPVTEETALAGVGGRLRG